MLFSQFASLSSQPACVSVCFCAPSGCCVNIPHWYRYIFAVLGSNRIGPYAPFPLSRFDPQLDSWIMIDSRSPAVATPPAYFLKMFSSFRSFRMLLHGLHATLRFAAVPQRGTLASEHVFPNSADMAGAPAGGWIAGSDENSVSI